MFKCHIKLTACSFKYYNDVHWAAIYLFIGWQRDYTLLKTAMSRCLDPCHGDEWNRVAFTERRGGGQRHPGGAQVTRGKRAGG